MQRFSLRSTKRGLQMTTKGVIFDIKRFAIHDGPGIRTTVFMKGCPLSCWWCHNPEGISHEKEIMFFEYKCMKCRTCSGVCPMDAIDFEGEDVFPSIDRGKCNGCGICADACPTGAMRIVGRKMSVDELMEELEKDVLLYDNSGGGVTFSGGEPLLQHNFLKEALVRCKDKGIGTALDTSGYAPSHVFRSVIEHVDIFLFDLKLGMEKTHKKYTGVSNIAIKDNLRMLTEMGRGSDVIIRVPVIPGITDTVENISELAKFLSTLQGIKQIELLPFHDVSEKYVRLSLEYKMLVRSAPTPETLERIKNVLESAGLDVKK
jgi:pyruvate formate lyase activating enzyme